MAKAKKGTAPQEQSTLSVEDISHEIVLNDPKRIGEPLKVLTVDETISLQIAKFNLPRATIAAWKEEYKDLATIAEDDKEGYKKLEEALKKVKKTRTSGENLRKDLVADALTVQRGINGEWGELEGLLREVEDPLQKRKTEIDKAKELREQEEQRLREQKRDERVADLITNGMTLQGGFYAIGEDISMDVVTIQAMTDDAFTVFRDRVVKVNEKVVEAKRLKEEAEEAERMRQQELTAENERKAEQLRQQTADLQRQRDELIREQAEMKKQVIEARQNSLAALGMTMQVSGNMRFHAAISETGDEFSLIEKADIEALPNDKFAVVMARVAGEIEAIKAKNAAYLEEKRIAQLKKIQTAADRRAELSALGMLPDISGNMFFSRNISDTLQNCTYQILKAQIEELSTENWAETMATAMNKVQVMTTQNLEYEEGKKQKEIKKQRLQLRGQQVQDKFGMKPTNNYGGAWMREFLEMPEDFAGDKVIFVTNEVLELLGDTEWNAALEVLNKQFTDMIAIHNTEVNRKLQEATEKKETARQAGLSEAQKVGEYADRVGLIKMPEVTNDVLAGTLKQFGEWIDTLRFMAAKVAANNTVTTE